MLKKLLCIVAVLALTRATDLYSYDLLRSGTRNTYTLYTRESLRLGTLVGSVTDLINSPFNASALTVIIVHDHEGSGTTTINPYLKDEILENEDVNVIIVDWSIYANLGYSNAVASVPSIAEGLAGFIQLTLLPAGGTEDNLHLIGFGLGAHVCGIAGRDLDGNISRITGLDPAGRLWGTGSQRLSTADAKFVEVIHTDGTGISHYGIGIALGHVDFFINGGGGQPGCLTSACSHNRAWEIMAASMGHRIIGSRCNGMLQNNLNLCKGVTLEVGTNNLLKRGSGIYRANTRRSYPYV